MNITPLPGKLSVISFYPDCDASTKKSLSPSSSPRPRSSHRSRSSLSKSQSVDSSPRDKSGAAEYKSPGHSSARDNKVSEFKNKSKSAFSKTVETSTPMEEWKEANLQRMSSKELVDHLEGLRNTVKRLQMSECKFKPVEEEEVSCG